VLHLYRITLRKLKLCMLESHGFWDLYDTGFWRSSSMHNLTVELGIL
jgi:hypothetical protein